MTFRVWWLFLITETVLSLSPGPAVLFVIAQGLRVGGRRAMWAALGIVSGNALWFLLSALGIGALAASAGGWFVALKWFGAAYLVYLALRPLVGRWQSQPGPLPTNEVEAVQAPRGGANLWARGLILQMTNPKALMFFTALLPQFIRAEENVPWQAFVLGVTSIVSEFPILVLYGALASRGAQLAREGRFARALDYAASALLLAAALGVALTDS